ncbi:hypothetical protein SCH01S_14_00180 [Sphingomonas changbaiensis NBRC 104936]|uniref:Uncharacterized protein n=1 Tax=Sphingomonas changbaiensis NBRC 104936 TaxID=1219043 RepID=A0A0E9MLD8_9SPHN|nr:hypothetical protein [Sphingomonas changbaiensis]GAO38354.1 hypothetical protein SCH01S_14_00180 [Sphingomonas changbaiensis NBRC 104936]
MELPDKLIEKYRPHPRKIGAPRNEREEIIERFRERLNAEQKRDGRPAFTYALLAKRFVGISDSGLFSLYTECDDPSVKSFGAMLTYKLRQIQG